MFRWKETCSSTPSPGRRKAGGACTRLRFARLPFRSARWTRLSATRLSKTIVEYEDRPPSGDLGIGGPPPNDWRRHKRPCPHLREQRRTAGGERHPFD